MWLETKGWQIVNRWFLIWVDKNQIGIDDSDFQNQNLNFKKLKLNQTQN
jgi:hypothetical protein